MLFDKQNDDSVTIIQDIPVANESDSGVATNQIVPVTFPLAESAGDEKVIIPDKKDDNLLEIKVSYNKPEKSEKVFDLLEEKKG